MRLWSLFPTRLARTKASSSIGMVMTIATITGDPRMA